MSISVTQPIDRALKRTALILFKPFKFGKWFVLGFCAFLSQCGEDSNGGFRLPNFGGSSGGSGGGGGPTRQEILDWFHTHLTLIIVIASASFLLIIGLSALISWLRARGTFMFIDGIATNRAAIAEPWREFRREANSLFLFTLGIGLLYFVMAMGIVGLCGWIAWPDINAGRFDQSAIRAIVVGGVLFILYGITFLIINLLV